jgi:hypothetical protein
MRRDGEFGLTDLLCELRLYARDHAASRRLKTCDFSLKRRFEDGQVLSPENALWLYLTDFWDCRTRQWFRLPADAAT